MKSIRNLGVLVTASLLLLACGDKDSGPAVFTIDATPAQAEIIQGQTADITITATRVNYDGPIEISVGTVMDVTADPVTIPRGETTATLTLTADAAEGQGVRPVVLEAWGGGLLLEHGIKVLVRGLPGTVDETFGNDGVRLADFGNEDDRVEDMLLHTDGRILLAGSAINANNMMLALAQLDPQGQLDPSFGVGGKVMSDLGPGIDVAEALTLDAMGRILVAGYSQMQGGNFSLARYTSSGQLDVQFANGNGWTSTDFFNNNYNGASTLMLTPNGEIVLAGAAVVATGLDFAVARYDSSGVLDPNFGTGGMASVNIGGNEDGANKVLPGANGGVLLLGTGILPVTNADAAMASFDAAGVLDTSWGPSGTGIETLALSDATESIDDAVVQPDGRIVAVGSATSDDMLVARYNTDGTLDTTFGAGNGYVTVDFFAGADNAMAVALDSNDNILVAGRAASATDDDLAIMRLLPDGTPDPTFGGTGKVILDVQGGDDVALAVAVQPNGRILIAGQSRGTGYSDFVIVRLWD